MRKRNKRRDGGGSSNERSKGGSRRGDMSAADYENSRDIDKYEKESLQKDLMKEKQFVYADLSSLKIYTLIVIFISALNAVFSILYSNAYKQSNITSGYYSASMIGILLVAIFGQISIVRVE